MIKYITHITYERAAYKERQLRMKRLMRRN